MNMREAIALSSSNKAKTTTEKGNFIVIQQRYNHNFWWFHIWIFGEAMGCLEFDTSLSKLAETSERWEFQPDSKGWQSV